MFYTMHESNTRCVKLRSIQKDDPPLVNSEITGARDTRLMDGIACIHSLYIIKRVITVPIPVKENQSGVCRIF